MKRRLVPSLVALFLSGGISSAGSSSNSMMVGLENLSPVTVTANARGVEFLSLSLCVWGGTDTVTSLTVKREGAGSVQDFDGVSWYEGLARLTTPKSLSSVTGEVIFDNLDIRMNNDCRYLSFVADLSGIPGNVNSFTVAAKFSLEGRHIGPKGSGRKITIAPGRSGEVVVSKVGSVTNPAGGHKKVRLTEFSLKVVAEDAFVRRITMLQGGTLGPTEISDVTLKADTVQWPGKVMDNGYFVFDLGPDFVIPKNREQTFEVHGDLAGKKGETVRLYFEEPSDILAVGSQYGIGMPTTITEIDTAAEAFDVTIQE